MNETNTPQTTVVRTSRGLSIAGTRITVQSVLELINEGITFNEIIRDYYPDLTIEDIRACVQRGLRSTI